MADVAELLERSGALLRGHFVLSSGRHSDVYVEKFRLLEQPAVLGELAGAIAAWARGHCPDVVAGPTTGGVIVAFEVARQMGLPALYVESVDGQKALRRGARVEPGARVLVVDDVLTTGLSVAETCEALRGQGAVPVAAAVLIDRSEPVLDLGVPVFGAHRVEAVSYPADQLPAWLAALPATKPGTRA